MRPFALGMLVLIVAISGTAQEGQKVTLTIGLADGSRIVGAPMSTSLAFKTQYASMTLDASLIRSIGFSEGGKMAKVLLRNGDILQGEFEFNALKVTTALGAQSIPLALVTSITAQGADIGNGLVLDFPLDNITGNLITDKSGHDISGRVNGVTTGNVNGMSCGEFDGSQSFIECQNSPTLNFHSSMSILAWLYPTVWGNGESNGVVSKKANDQSNGFVLYNDGYSPTKLNLRMRGTAGVADMLHSNGDVDTDVLQHWAVTFDASTGEVRFYKNGVLDTVYRNVSVGDIVNGMPLHIGHAQTWNGFFEGSLAHVMLYARALSPEEVEQVYNAQKAPTR